MSQSQSEEAVLSVRLVVLDHYLAEPLDGLDPRYSDRGFDIRRVPVLRVFGSTPAGQRTTLHVHGIFPYLYVPLPEKENEGFGFRLAASLDLALNVSLNQSKSQVQHVYKAVKVTGIPFYGYHPRHHSFIKLYFYNYYMLKRAADLLAGGAVMNKILQPHESHVPFELQFMMDYNLQGMNLVHLRHAMFRQGQLRDEYDDIKPFFDLKSPRASSQHSREDERKTDSSVAGSSCPTSPYRKLQSEPAFSRLFYLDQVPPSLLLPPEIPRTATTELEVDAVAADILNCNQLSAKEMNPGLKMLWEDERERRRMLGMENDPLTPPDSPPRPSSALEKTESEQFWYERFKAMLADKKEAEGDNSNPTASSDPDATVNIPDGIGVSVYAQETPEEELRYLPNATQLEPHVSTLSESLLHPTQSFLGTPARSQTHTQASSYNDQTIVDESLIHTQVSLDESDVELVDMLAGLLDDEDNQDSNSAIRDNNDSEDKSTATDNDGKEADSDDSSQDIFAESPSSVSASAERVGERAASSTSDKHSPEPEGFQDMSFGSELFCPFSQITSPQASGSIHPSQNRRSVLPSPSQGSKESSPNRGLVDSAHPSPSQGNKESSQNRGSGDSIHPSPSQGSRVSSQNRGSRDSVHPSPSRVTSQTSHTNQSCHTPTSHPRSQIPSLSTFCDNLNDDNDNLDDDYDDDVETLEMSQIVWESDIPSSREVGPLYQSPAVMDSSLWDDDLADDDFLNN